jgi:adenosylhomocysteine nucleosidase
VGAGERVVVLCAMASELRPVVRQAGLSPAGDGVFTGSIGAHAVTARVMGVGPARAAATAEQVVGSGGVDRVVVVGIAGGLDPALAIGQVLVPAVVVDGETGAEHRTPPWDRIEPRGRLVTFGDFGAEMAAIPRLRAEGCAAVDMETAAVAAVCERHGCPWAAFRAISDDATDGTIDAAVAAMARPDGSVDTGAALGYLLRRPWRLPRLARLGRDAALAARAAAAAAVAALAPPTG